MEGGGFGGGGRGDLGDAILEDGFEILECNVEIHRRADCPYGFDLGCIRGGVWCRVLQQGFRV